MTREGLKSFSIHFIFLSLPFLLLPLSLLFCSSKALPFALFSDAALFLFTLLFCQASFLLQLFGSPSRLLLLARQNPASLCSFSRRSYSTRSPFQIQLLNSTNRTTANWTRVASLDESVGAAVAKTDVRARI